MHKIEARRLSLILIILGPLLLFSRMLLAGEVLYWGTPMLQFVPWHRFALQTLSQGHIPLWNPLLGLGAPLLANLQSALLYPPNLLLIIFGPEHGHGYLVVLHLILAGIGMARLARRLGMGPFSQLIAGLSFSLSGYMVARAWFISINHAAAWLPWIILSAESLLEGSTERWKFKRSLPAILGLTVALAMQWLAGHAQTSWYSALLLAGWIAWGIRRNLTKSSVLWVSSRFALAGILAFAITAVQLLPTLEYLSFSQRAGDLAREFAFTYSFWPWRLLGLLFPGMYGDPATGNYWGYGNYWEDAIYIGVLPLLLSLGSIWQALQRRKPGYSLERFLLAISILTLVLALGQNTPVFPFLFDHVPTFNLFQAPARWNLLFVFSLALLAARGAEGWATPKGWGLYWSRLLTAGAGIIAIATYFGFQLLRDLELSFVRSFVVGGLLLTASGMLTLFLPKQRTHLKVGIVGGVLLLDLILTGWGLNPSISPEVFEGNVLGEVGIHPGDRIYMPADLEQRLKFEQTHRFDTFEPGIEWRLIREMGLPNTNMLDGVASFNNFDPLVVARYANFSAALESMGATEKDALLSWMDVAYRSASDPADPNKVIFDRLAPSGRVHLVHDVVVASSAADALTLLTSGRLDLASQVILEDVLITNIDGKGSGEVLTLHESGPNSLSIDVWMQEHGWLVLADAWYPGWRATLDGSPLEIIKANYLFRAVEVPAGEHKIEFRYQPLSFMVGGLLSIVGIISASCLGYLCFRRD